FPISMTSWRINPAKNLHLIKFVSYSRPHLTKEFSQQIVFALSPGRQQLLLLLWVVRETTEMIKIYLPSRPYRFIFLSSPCKFQINHVQRLHVARRQLRTARSHQFLKDI